MALEAEPTRAVVVHGIADSAHADRAVDRLAAGFAPDVPVRRATCATDDAEQPGATLNRLLGPDPDAALASGPLVLAVLGLDRCDPVTLAFLVRAVRRPPGPPRLVLLMLPYGARVRARVAYHELLAGPGVQVMHAADLGLTPRPEEAVRADSGLAAVLRAVAVLRDTDTDLVGAVAGLPPRLVARALDTARAGGLLTEPLPPPGRPHPLDRLLTGVDPGHVELMHARAAQALDHAARPAPEVADHLLAQPSLEWPWTVQVLREAATAARLDAPAAAVRYLARLVRADPRDTAARVDLAGAMLDIDPVSAAYHLGSTPRPPAATGVLAGLMTHERPETPTELDGLIAVWPDPADGTVLGARALRTALSGTALEDAVGDASRAIEAGRAGGGWAAVAAARALRLADQTPAALAHLDRVVTAARHRQESWVECQARSARALMLMETGEVREAMAEARAAGQIAHTHEWPAQARLPMIIGTLGLLHCGAVDRAETLVRRLEAERFAGSMWEHHYALTVSALLYHRRDRLEQAHVLLEACGADLTSAGIANPLYTTWWVASTDILVRLGHRSAAADRAEQGRHLALRWPAARSVGLSLMTRAVVAAVPARVELLEESVRMLGASSDRPHLALAELRLGRALIDVDDRRAARAHLHAARSIATHHGLVVLAGRAQALLAAAGGRSPAAVPDTSDVLTAAERPVADLAAAGASNREIAATLFITVRTVEYHLTSIYRKLGVSGRADLVRTDGGPDR